MAAVICAGVPAFAQEPSCLPDKPRRGVVSSVDERLELTLEGGVRLRLSGVEAARATASSPHLPREGRDALREWLVGREIEYSSPTAAPDRWGRLEARVAATVPAGGAPVAVASAIIDAGLARALPEAGARGCITELLRAEAAARADRLGIWRDPAYAILRGADRSAFSGRGGETIVVEGRVTGFGETRFRTYLNFGPIRTVDFAVTFARQGLKNLETAGLQPASLEGKTLRVRGLLDTRFGPQIKIIEPAAIEILTDSAAPPQSRPLARR